MPKPSSTVDTQITPDPTLEKRSRRKFSTEYKLKIIQLADACKHGEPGPMLRKEKLYANQPPQWRKEYAEEGITSLEKVPQVQDQYFQLNKNALFSWSERSLDCANRYLSKTTV